MIAALFAVGLIVIAGWPLASLLDSGSGAPSTVSRIGEAYLLGAGMAAAVLFADSALGIAWSRATTIVPLLIVSAIAAAIAGRTLAVKGSPRVGAANLVDLLTMVLGIGYARFATVGPSPENDFIEIWGLKAREFAAAHAIDWQFLEQPFNRFSHVDYPILLPLLFDFHVVVGGEWPGRWLGVVNVGFGAATLLLLRRFLADEPSPLLWRTLATMALFSSAFSPWLGLAECAVLAYGTAALLFLRRAIRSGVNADFARGAIYLGLAANSKNEGITLIAAAACALIVAGAWKSISRLWPAVALALPWLVLRGLHHLQTDLMTSGMAERAWERTTNLGLVFRLLAHDSPGRPLFWIGIAIAVLLASRELVRHERFLVSAIVIQFLFFLAAYIVTPHDVAWHVRWSWERLVSQLAAPVAFVAVVLIGRIGFPAADGGKLPSAGRP